MGRSVFLIHDVHEKPIARQLAIDLSVAGAAVWLDEGEIGEAQDSLIRMIEKVAPGEVHLLVILSPDSAGSDWIRHEAELLMNRQAAGPALKLMPLLYRDCDMPAFMADMWHADLRNPADYPVMLQRIIDRLELAGNGRTPALPAALSGTWQGAWTWCGRQRDADLFLSASPSLPSRMVIRYLKSGILSIVWQELDVQISGNAVNLIGTAYRMIERGISTGWNLDTFKLTVNESGSALEGVNTDKRGLQAPVVFVRK